MVYRSNLKAPDLAPYFKLASPAIQILGHDLPSDPDHSPNCGFFSHDEAAILYNVALQVKGMWADIGARFGWTAMHLLMAGCEVHAVDQAFSEPRYILRFFHNMSVAFEGIGIDPDHGSYVIPFACSSACFFADYPPGQAPEYNGCVIDADHDPPQPLLDAQRCAHVASSSAVIVLHDFQGEPVRDAVRWLMYSGWRARVYWTPNGLAVCWRGARGFVPPDHTPDPSIDWAAVRRGMKDFPFERCV